MRSLKDRVRDALFRLKGPFFFLLSIGILGSCAEKSDYERALQIKQELNKECLDKFWGMQIEKFRPAFVVTTAEHNMIIVQDSTGFQIEEVKDIDFDVYYSDGLIVTESEALMAVECFRDVRSKVVRGVVLGKEKVLEFYPTESLDVYYIPEIDSLSSQHYSNLQRNCHNLGDGWYYSGRDKRYDPSAGIWARTD